MSGVAFVVLLAFSPTIDASRIKAQTLLGETDKAAGNMSETLYTTGKVQITLNWVPPVLDLTRAFELTWKAIPVTVSSEFKISGDLWHIRKTLMKRPDLPVTCPMAYVGKPVHLVVQDIMPSGVALYQKAFAGGFANVGGLFTLATTLGSVYSGAAVAAQIASLASNPTPWNLDAIIEKLVVSMDNTKTKSFKLFWKWLTGQKTSAFLTLADPARKGYYGSVVKFKCMADTNNFGGGAYVSVVGSASTSDNIDVNGDNQSTPTQGDQLHSLPIESRHLALMLASLG